MRKISEHTDLGKVIEEHLNGINMEAWNYAMSTVLKNSEDELD